MFPLNNVITIESLSHDGRGIGRSDGKTIFVTGALTSEEVEVLVYKKHKSFDEAISKKVLSPSLKRIEPRCSHFLLCGGCSLQHLSSESQLAHKKSVLLEQLQHFGKVMPESIAEPSMGDSSEQWQYRARARLSVKYVAKKEKVFIGFRELTNSRCIADIKQCEILLPIIGYKIESLRDFIGKCDAKDQIAQIEVVGSEAGCALIVRQLVPLSKEDENAWMQWGEENNLWIIFQLKKSSAIGDLFWVTPREPQNFYYTLKDFDESLKSPIKFLFEPNHFTQINPKMNERLVKKALDWLAPTSDDVILDLFCGLGNFSLPLAKYAGWVVGVEGSDAMVTQATLNANLNHIKNTKFFAANLMETEGSKDFRNAPWMTPFGALGVNKDSWDKILLDPPRTGALEIVQTMDKWNPSRIVYVSCNPATLARDAGILVNEKGYTLKKVGVADMFPHTTHVESIALFEK